ncbi:hypothetical protein ALC60_12346 [Trachymyrmex zeteki]|uniref:Uncharacterized protein n=1 Tax=Mycetomoellerius zeteki TaxID=64791 RepID=A0A151WL35_9HYME|nr:hypothetical protein ALC60_12346 [Trachymyrmex zeteki]
MEGRQRRAYACRVRRRESERERVREKKKGNTLVHVEEATTAAPDWSKARYSFVLRRGCFLLRRWCVTRRRKKKGGVRGNGKRHVIGRFRALCRLPRLRGCVCATLFAQQLEAGISSPRKSPPHSAQVRKGEKQPDELPTRPPSRRRGRRA